MNAVILACSSLRDYVNEAQKKRNTEYPVIWLSEAYHVDPQKMHQHIIDKVKELPKEVDTILVAMGYASMWAAVFGDVGVSVLAILNAIRVLSYRRKL